MNAINVISPYKHHGMWVFDDNRDATRSPAWRQHHRDQSALAVIFLSDLGHQFGGLFLSDDWPKKLQNVMAVTEPPSQFWQAHHQRGIVMKKIFLVLALAFAFSTGMAVVTVIAHTDQAAASSVR